MYERELHIDLGDSRRNSKPEVLSVSLGCYLLGLLRLLIDPLRYIHRFVTENCEM